MSAQASQSSRPLVIDGLNCAGLTREQLIRTKEGGVSALNLTAIRPPAGLHDALLQLEQARDTIESMPDLATIVTTVDEIKAAHEKGVIGIILGAQNTLMAEPDVKLLASFKSLGMRIIQPTYNERNAFGYGASFTNGGDKGITEAGRQWLATMEELGILVDLSHCGHKTSADYIAAAKSPLVFSHANAFALCPSPRNKPDDLIRAVAKNGGLIGAVTWAPLLRWDVKPSLDDVIDHMQHLIKVGGIDHVAYASDLPEANGEDQAKWETMWGPNGIYPNITGVLGDWYQYGNHVTTGMQTMSQTPTVWDKMRARGFHESEIEKVMSGNWLRVLGDVWPK
ncbi:dipeptidase [Microvirga flavescens]|uniref:dipeptidase n=1 Tax=Microvirga flavescens TaxID=2249811 RepID=UPI0013008C74|nr:membrane dipeptidase [Microvirga flavescens]